VVATDNITGYAVASTLGAAVGMSISCVWMTGGSWLGVADLAAHGQLATEVRRTICGVKPKRVTYADPCLSGEYFGYCDRFRDETREPGEQIITYTTEKPAPTCQPVTGEKIFINTSSPKTNGTPIGIKTHTGRLKNGIVYDSIYPSGIPLNLWEDGVYFVPGSCLKPDGIVSDPDDELTFIEAVRRGIGRIEIRN
jgi:hypothetical protein